MTEDRLIVDLAMLKRMGLTYSRYHIIHRLVPAGHFPKPFKVGKRPNAKNLWYWSEVKPFFERKDTE